MFMKPKIDQLLERFKKGGLTQETWKPGKYRKLSGFFIAKFHTAENCNLYDKKFKLWPKIGIFRTGILGWKMEFWKKIRNYQIFRTCHRKLDYDNWIMIIKTEIPAINPNVSGYYRKSDFVFKNWNSAQKYDFFWRI